MTDAFAELVLPIVQRMIELRDRLAYESPTLEEVKRQTRGWIESAEKRAVVGPALAADFELAKFGLVAWIDELLTDSNWGRSVDWGSEDHVLEWDVFHSHDRAWLFYKHSDAVEARQAFDPLEAYLLFVALGFRGRFIRDEAGMLQWIERVYEKVNAAGAVAPRPFPEDPADAAGPGLVELRGPSLLLTASVLAAATAVLTTIAYIGAVGFSYAAP